MTITPTSTSFSLPPQLLPALQQLTETLSQLVTVLQSQIQPPQAPLATAQANAGATSLGGGDVAAAMPGGGCCCGMHDAVAGSMGGPAREGAAAAPAAPAASNVAVNDPPPAPKQQSKKPAAAAVSAPPRSTSDLATVKAFIRQAAGVYGANPDVLTKIAEKESSFKADAVNDWDINAKNGTPSKGMFQFIKPTFDSYAKQARDANPAAWQGLGDLDWMDWRQQALATAWAIKNGHGSAWATFIAAGGTS